MRILHNPNIYHFDPQLVDLLFPPPFSLRSTIVLPLLYMYMKTYYLYNLICKLYTKLKQYNRA